MLLPWEDASQDAPPNPDLRWRPSCFTAPFGRHTRGRPPRGTPTYPLTPLIHLSPIVHHLRLSATGAAGSNVWPVVRLPPRIRTTRLSVCAAGAVASAVGIGLPHAD